MAPLREAVHILGDTDPDKNPLHSKGNIRIVDLGQGYMSRLEDAVALRHYKVPSKLFRE